MSTSTIISLPKRLNLILDFSDIFALDQTELSSTDVNHVIDTGYSISIPRRIPFALHGKVDQLVAEMLDQGIVVPSKSL